jgi:membrane fusion protein, multidrug efflux system
LPASAVFFRDERPKVWRLTPEGDRVAAVDVTLVKLGAEKADVTGLATGDRIVTLGVHRLDETLPLRVVEMVTVAAGQNRSLLQ